MLVLAFIADQFLFLWLMGYAVFMLWSAQVYEACLLIFTATFYRRFERQAVIDFLKAKMPSEQGNDL